MGDRGTNYGQMKLDDNRQSGNNFDLNQADKMGRGRNFQSSRVGNLGVNRAVLRLEDRGICFRCG